MLKVDNIETFYGQSQALFGMTLSADKGEVVTLMGRNGAGKTTTVRSIIGFTPPRSGAITFDSQRTERWPAYRVAQAGIGLVPEGRQIFPNLSVHENLLATSANRRNEPNAWAVDQVYELFPRLAERRTHMGNQISGGEQQMVAIGRAVMAKPRLLLLDEPSSGLAPQFINEIGTIIQALKDDGATMLMVEQNLALAFKVADRFIILRDGVVSDGGFVKSLEGNHEEIVRTIYL